MVKVAKTLIQSLLSISLVTFSSSALSNQNTHSIKLGDWTHIAKTILEGNCDSQTLLWNSKDGRVKSLIYTCNTFYDENFHKLTNPENITGSWNGFRAKSMSLKDLTHKVYDSLNAHGQVYLVPEQVKDEAFSQFFVESKLNNSAVSDAGALGIIQAKPEIYERCNISAEHRGNRIAQVGCFYKHMNWLADKLPKDLGITNLGKTALLQFGYHNGVGNMGCLVNQLPKNTVLNENHVFTGILENYGNCGIGPETSMYIPKIKAVKELETN